MHIARTAAGFGHETYAGGFDKGLRKKAKCPRESLFPVREPSLDKLRELVATGYTVIAMQEGGENPSSIHWTERMVLLVGKESGGIPEEYQPLVSRSVWIPMQGLVRCFNASDAAVMVMYEAMNQQYWRAKYGPRRELGV
jgi:tRNA(Leu) C34 or U34 (ribose-2'-O)-methylase TrmL